MVAKLGSKIIG